VSTPPHVSGGTRLTPDVSGAPQPHDGPVPSPADLDAVLTVLVRHVRDLAGLGAVRIAAGAVTLEVGPATTAEVAPAPVVGPPPVLAAVPDPEPPVGVLDCSVGNTGPTVCSTTVGVFYRAAEPGAAPFVAEGDTVAVGQQIGIVEAMKLMIPLESDRAGTIAEILVGDGDAVEHGQPVLRLASS
jgi:acetyl-CoA carboxylase biotin carboxyl carrier protein